MSEGFATFQTAWIPIEKDQLALLGRLQNRNMHNALYNVRRKENSMLTGIPEQLVRSMPYAILQLIVSVLQD